MKLDSTWLLVIACAGGAGCLDQLRPQVDDQPGGSSNILPAGSEVPAIANDAELVSQIRLNDGLVDATLAMTGGVVMRQAGKAGGMPVMFWNFGAAPMEGVFAVAAPVYILASADGSGGFVPLPDHPYLLDTICGDVRYSPIRRIQYVPVTASYAGQLLTSTAALRDAIELGLVGEPQPAGTWVNMPVVTPDTRLDVGGGAPPLAPTQVFARGFRVDVFTFGGSLGIQPLRANTLPLAQLSSLQTGVATGTPPTLSTSFDPAPVFQLGIPAAPPTMAFNYTPLVTEVQVRLATGIAPAAITGDGDLFKRGATGAISSFRTDNVASFTITTTVTNRPIQFVEGAP